jgi:hypothetical protein
MNAIVPNESTDDTAEHLLWWIDGRDARRAIVDRYLTGWCTAEFALETLIGLGLIEFSAEAAK